MIKESRRRRRSTKKIKGRCQCMRTCTLRPLKNLPFCKKHTFCPRKAPLSGYEPEFNPDIYNNHEGLKDAQNCFAYAFDYRKLPKGCTAYKCPASFPQPGSASGYPSWGEINGKRCPDLLARLFGDVKGIKMSSFEERCPKHYSKIAAVIDEDEDYHFYRQDKNGYWSHKPGSTNVTRLDGTGRPIYDPRLASRYYSESGLNYDEFCSYLCVPKNTNIHFKRGGKRSIKRNKTKKRKKSYVPISNLFKP